MKKTNKKIIGLSLLAILAAQTTACAYYQPASDVQVAVPAKEHSNYINDTVITAQVKTRLATSSILKSQHIDVRTENRVVYLKGVVATNTQYREAVSLAIALDSVRDVNTNGLSVKGSNAPLTDSFITAKIKGELMKDSLRGVHLSPLSTHIETKNGIVYLSGQVNNQAEINNAIKIAKSVEGVKAVRSSLRVKNS